MVWLVQGMPGYGWNYQLRVVDGIPLDWPWSIILGIQLLNRAHTRFNVAIILTFSLSLSMQVSFKAGEWATWRADEAQSGGTMVFWWWKRSPLRWGRTRKIWITVTRISSAFSCQDWSSWSTTDFAYMVLANLLGWMTNMKWRLGASVVSANELHTWWTPVSCT